MNAKTCKSCDGTGSYLDADDQVHVCPACRGTNKPSELAKRIAESLVSRFEIGARGNGKTWVDAMSPVIAEHIAPLEAADHHLTHSQERIAELQAALAASQAECERLRTAAELVRASQQRVEIDPLTLTVKDVDPRPRAFPTSEEHWDAVNDLADAYLAEHAADDGDFLDEDWFVSEKWSEHSLYFSKLIDHPTPIELRIGPPEDDGTWTVALNQAEAADSPTGHDDCVCLQPVKTRGEVRRLCEVLGAR